MQCRATTTEPLILTTCMLPCRQSPLLTSSRRMECKKEVLLFQELARKELVATAPDSWATTSALSNTLLHQSLASSSKALLACPCQEQTSAVSSATLLTIFAHCGTQSGPTIPSLVTTTTSATKTRSLGRSLSHT